MAGLVDVMDRCLRILLAIWAIGAALICAWAVWMVRKSEKEKREWARRIEAEDERFRKRQARTRAEIERIRKEVSGHGMRGDDRQR